MKVVYNSDHYSVVEYPTVEAYELVDKASGFGTFLRGDVAARFRESMGLVIANQPSIDEFDEFLGSYEPWMTQKLTLH